MVPLCSIFRRFLRTQDLKYTPERAGILDAIIERDAIFEVDELLEDLRERGDRISKATVYRTLKLLQDAGIVTPAIFDARQTHYQLIYGRAPRDYMVCMRTGRYVAFEAPELAELRRRIAKQHGWEAFAHRFQIYAMSPITDDEPAADAPSS